MLDSAVTWFGITIENALHERVKLGNEYKPKYSLTRLLHPGFKLPRPPEEMEYNSNPFTPFLSWTGKANSLVKRYKYVPPPEEDKAQDG